MLGSFFVFVVVIAVFLVSKPYRYARKHPFIISDRSAGPWFQNLIGMLGSLRKKLFL